jgi:Protein of unknown function (DUF1570)
VKTRCALVIVLVTLCVVATPVAADIVIVRLGEQLFTMEGKIADPKQRIITVTHEKFRKGSDGKSDLKLNLMYREKGELLSIEDMIIVPSRKQQYQKQLSEAQKGGTEERLKLATWAIKNGLVQEFYNAIELVRQSDPDNEIVKRVLEVKAKMSVPITDSSAEQKYMTDTLPPGMKFKTSDHYIIAYDTPDSKAQERLELVERVYETFLSFFAFKGRVLEPPPYRLMVTLFNEHKQYLDFSTRLDPSLNMAAGYWSPESNLAVFFAQGTYPALKELQDKSKEWEQLRKDLERQNKQNRGDIVRFADTLKLLVLVAVENQDLEVVTHEATHQIAGNCGLFPRRIRIPQFAQEGLAAFFESPSDANWSGVGAVNKRRLQYYRALADKFNDREHSNIDFVVSDQIYTRAGSHATVLHAYGQAWALTHFLMDKHFDELQQFWKNLARLPGDMIVSEPDLVRCFDDAFGKDRNKLDMEWRRHMDSLKTDIDKLKEQHGVKLAGS